MATLYFSGNEVAFFTGASSAGQNTTFTGVNAPFAATDLVIIEVPDQYIGASGEFSSSSVGFTSVTVVRGGVSHDFDVAPDSMILEQGPGGTPVAGDTFFSTASSVGAPASGPFAGMAGGKMVFTTNGSFTTGQNASIDRTQAQDLNGDGDAFDLGEAPNARFNIAPSSSPPPCYAPGTLIDTPSGARAVESLRPGDLVTTRDNGPQPVRWMRVWHQKLTGLPPERRPVLVAAGALGPGLPFAPMVLSPQHRLLAGGAGQLARLAAQEVLVPVKALTALPGIRHMMGRKSAPWVHFLCDRHEVIRANGVWSETMLLGPMAHLALPARDHAVLRATLPRASTPARPCLSGAEARQLLAGAGAAPPNRLAA